MRAPSARTTWYSQGGRIRSNTLAATSTPDSTPGWRATMTASPFRSGSTIDWVVTSAPLSPRSSRSASATISSSSGFDATIRHLPQSKCLLREAEKIRTLAAHAALLARGLDDAAVDHPAPKVAAIYGEPEHRLVHVLELADRELRRKELETDRRVSDLAAQAADRVINDLTVVERHLDGESADWMPLLLAIFCLAGACVSQRRRDDGDVGAGDHVTTRVATRHDDLA